MPDELDKILSRYGKQCEKGYGTETVGKEQAKAQLNAHYLAEILEVIGRQKPYKGGNNSYWEGQKALRAELRATFQAKYGGK